MTMLASDWILLTQVILIATGISVSLFLGLRSIRQTKDIQQRQYRNNLLDDVIKWAENVLECGMEKSTMAVANVTDKAEEDRRVLAYATDLQLEFQRMIVKSQHMSKVAFQLQYKSLLDAIDDLNKELGMHVDAFQRYRGAVLVTMHEPGTPKSELAKTERDKVSREIQQHKNKLEKAANTVIELSLNAKA